MRQRPGLRPACVPHQAPGHTAGRFYFGISTVSITWITPFDWYTS
jgi:hypothetical protein